MLYWQIFTAKNQCFTSNETKWLFFSVSIFLIPLASLAVLYEEMHWLIIISGFVLSDNNKDGEHLPPSAINEFSLSFTGDIIQNPVLELMRLIFNLCELENLV